MQTDSIKQEVRHPGALISGENMVLDTISPT